jgi:hypothetical protein
MESYKPVRCPPTPNAIFDRSGLGSIYEVSNLGTVRRISDKYVIQPEKRTGSFSTVLSVRMKMDGHSIRMNDNDLVYHAFVATSDQMYADLDTVGKRKRLLTVDAVKRGIPNPEDYAEQMCKEIILRSKQVAPQDAQWWPIDVLRASPPMETDEPEVFENFALFYEVSRDGKLRSSMSLYEYEYDPKPSTCHNYKFVGVQYKFDKRDIKKSVPIHRMVACAFVHKEQPEHNVVDHIDRNRANNHVSNLRWTTPYGNAQNRTAPVNITSRSLQGTNLDGNVVSFESPWKAADYVMTHGFLPERKNKTSDANNVRSAIARACSTHGLLYKHRWTWKINREHLDATGEPWVPPAYAKDNCVYDIDHEHWKNRDIRVYYRLGIVFIGSVPVGLNESDTHGSMYNTIKAGKCSVMIHLLIWCSYMRSIDQDWKLTKGFCINHIDHNKKNNVISNLEKVTYSDNGKAAVKMGKTACNRKKVACYTMTDPDTIHKQFNSNREAADWLIGLGHKDSASSISKCCNPKNPIKTTCGYYWRYLES